MSVASFLDFSLTPSLLRRRAVSPQPRATMFSVSCRACTAKTATIWAQCSLPDLIREHLRSVFPAGPQLRPAVLSVPCRTSTATICAQCSLPDLNREIDCQKICQKEFQKERMSDRMSEDMSRDMSESMSEDMSERMSDRTSEDMSERMSERM